MGSVIYSKCLPKDESYKRFVEKTSLAQSYEENEKSIRLLKKHLECHPEKEVFYKLAVIYEYSQKHYLAEIAYQKARKDDDQKRMANIIINKKGAEKEKFIAIAEYKAAKHLELYKNKKTAATVFHIAGPIAFATGLSLFIHDKAGGKNSLTAQYTLMFGGLSMIAGGTILNAHAEKDFLLSEAYISISEDAGVDYGLTPDEYFASSGGKAQLHKNYSGKYMNRGFALIFISIPMIAFAVYGFIDSDKHLDDKYPDELGIGEMGLFFEKLLKYYAQSLTLAPAVFSIVIGARMMARGSKWEKLNTEPTLFTLNSIAPIIDPVSKTYGLSMGFSF
jgi:tetratricopeptide (TPR) repeat protein